MKQVLCRSIALILAAGVACTESSKTAEPPTSPSAAENPAPSANAEPAEAREIAIEVQTDGYHPAAVEVEPGEDIVLVFTRTTESRCAEKLVVPSADVERDLPLNEPVRVALTAPDRGRLAFACGMDMLQGALVVQ